MSHQRDRPYGAIPAACVVIMFTLSVPMDVPGFGFEAGPAVKASTTGFH